MRILEIIKGFSVTAVVLAACLALFTGSASADSLSTVSTASGLCLSAASPDLGTAVTVSPCNPQDPTQSWVFTTDDHLRIPGTNRYVTAGSGGATEVGSFAQAITWTYGNDHTLSDANGKWLVLCTGAQPFMNATQECTYNWWIYTQG